MQGSVWRRVCAGEWVQGSVEGSVCGGVCAGECVQGEEIKLMTDSPCGDQLLTMSLIARAFLPVM